MQVRLDFRNSAKTGVRKFILTVFKQNPYGLDRIYQLEIVQSRRPIKDLHERSHEHMGSSRLPGKESWGGWAFSDVLRYFWQQTNVTFCPPPPDPEEYQLKG